MKNRRKQMRGRILLLSVFAGFWMAGCGNLLQESPAGQNSQWERGTEQDSLQAEDSQKGAAGGSSDGTLEVHYIDVGQGDATLIRQGSHAMLIDGGNNDKGTALQSYLQYQGIEHLDYVIGTHPDADHVGGLDVVMYKFPWDTVILPDLEKDTRTYQDVLNVIAEQGKKITYPAAGTVYKLGEAEYTIIAPAKEDYGDNWNDYSVGILLQFGENRFIFTGDAEEQAEQDMMEEGLDLSADVLKAAHHGSDTANTMEFLEEVEPDAVVISCGEGNSYGHPRAGAMNNFRSIGAKVYRTDEQGTIVAVSDGREITWNCSPSESWKAGEPGGGREEEPEQAAGTGRDTAGRNLSGEDDAETEYVLNTNTGKFHRPSCGSVAQMQEENREYTDCSRQELIEEQGYEPCSRCKP